MKPLCNNCKIRLGIYEFTDVDRKGIAFSCERCFDIVHQKVNNNLEKINEKNNKRTNYQSRN